jgi:hypothetical protein
MAAPKIRFKRGLIAQLPALGAGEPAFSTDKYDFYIGLDNTSENNKFFGSARYWQKEDVINGTSAVLKLVNPTGAGSINLKTPDAHTGFTTYTLPSTAPVGSGHFLTADSSGNLSWESVSASATFIDANLTGITTITYIDGTDADFSGITTISTADINGGNIDGTIIGQTTPSSGYFTLVDTTDLVSDYSTIGVATATDLYVDATRVLYDDGSGITLAGIATIDSTTKATLETILSLDPNDFDTLNVAGIGTFGGQLNANGGLDVTGHSELDDVNVSGAATFATAVDADILGNAGSATSLATARDFDISGSFITASAVSFDGTGNVSLAATITADSILLGTYTSGDYVASFTAGDGLSGDATGEGSTPTLSVNVGAGITITSDAVAFRNAASLSDNTLQKWDATNEQLVNTIVTDNGSTATVGGNLTVTGDLTINGTTTQVNTTELTVYDRTITLGIQTGATPADTSWDLGVLMNYGDAGVAKTSGVIWEYGNKRFQFAADANNPAVGVNTTTPNIDVFTFAPIEVGGLWVNNACSSGVQEVIGCLNSELQLMNIVVDGGSFA